MSKKKPSKGVLRNNRFRPILFKKGRRRTYHLKLKRIMLNNAIMRAIQEKVNAREEKLRKKYEKRFARA